MPFNPIKGYEKNMDTLSQFLDLLSSGRPEAAEEAKVMLASMNRGLSPETIEQYISHFAPMARVTKQALGDMDNPQALSEQYLEGGMDTAREFKDSVMNQAGLTGRVVKDMVTNPKLTMQGWLDQLRQFGRDSMR